MRPKNIVSVHVHELRGISSPAGVRVNKFHVFVLIGAAWVQVDFAISINNLRLSRFMRGGSSFTTELISLPLSLFPSCAPRLENACMPGA